MLSLCVLNAIQSLSYDLIRPQITVIQLEAAMDNHFVLQLAFVGAVVILSVSGSFSPTLPNDATILSHFTAVGTVDGKTFFADKIMTGSWAECKSFCNSSGMHLAVITSTQQRRVLDTASYPYVGSYWTGGRDSQTTSQFLWDFNQQTLNNSFTSLDVYEQILTCVYYHPSLKQLRSAACSSLARPLCEFVHGK